MTTFTDKELIKEIKERIGSLHVRDNVERRAYEIALASLEAEPLAWLHSDNGLGIPAQPGAKTLLTVGYQRAGMFSRYIWLSQCRWCRMVFRL